MPGTWAWARWRCASASRVRASVPTAPRLLAMKSSAAATAGRAVSSAWSRAAAARRLAAWASRAVTSPRSSAVSASSMSRSAAIGSGGVAFCAAVAEASADSARATSPESSPDAPPDSPAASSARASAMSCSVSARAVGDAFARGRELGAEPADAVEQRLGLRHRLLGRPPRDDRRAPPTPLPAFGRHRIGCLDRAITRTLVSRRW